MTTFGSLSVAPTPWLDGKHAVFGRVTEGLDLVIAISKVPRNVQDRPNTNVTIRKIVIVEQ